ncbi:DUF1045 domain-containing protein [Pararhizobium antarcticum]|uniref:Phosphonate metabolism protein n=1 Tax=Pararhizobium antarcticum TaxID=1798805 RepID=A0A657LS70_9HYPH|nr:DUF1045 domain-containing protein [Pararhizobium antarcticum]OJF95540.1 hypothetical protein AX761_17415 [Rhizobium sp. 58]OJF96889.1 hypothetical protein AX760_03255 [Pararhizobium antarcticum]
MRYAIYFTPPIHDPLSIAAESWLGRNVYSGEVTERPSGIGLSSQELAFYTAVPRRYGFHATIKSPFHLHPDRTEAGLLKALMQFAGTVTPFEMPRMEIARLGDFFGIAPVLPCEAMQLLAAKVVQLFDEFRAPLGEAEIERRDPDGLTAPQFSNLHRWGYPYVMDEFRFHMALTGPLSKAASSRLETALKHVFAALMTEPVRIASLALFVEPEPGAPLRVHSQHPLGKITARRPSLAPGRPGQFSVGDPGLVFSEQTAAAAVRGLERSW